MQRRPDDYVLVRRRDRTRMVRTNVILGLLLTLSVAILLTIVVVLVIGALGIWVFTHMGDPLGMPDPKPPGQVELSIDGLGAVRSITSSSSKAGLYVYVLDDHDGGGRVLQMAPDGTDVTQLPFPPLQQPQDIAVDDMDNVYVVDNNSQGNGVVYKLAAGAEAPVELPLADVGFIEAIALDKETQTVYLAVRGDGDDPGRVLELRSWETEYTQLPIDGVTAPIGLGFNDSSGDLYVLDRQSRLVLEVYVGRDLPVERKAELGDCQPTGLSTFGSIKYITCDGGGLAVIMGDGNHARDVQIDGSVVDITNSNGNWRYVALEDGSVITFVEDL